MNAMTQELRAAGRRLTATPAAMFVAVLTAGFAIASAAHHAGLYSAGARASRQSSVVLACPRTSAAKSTAAGHKTTQASPAAAPQSTASFAAPAAPNSGVSSEKQAAGKTRGNGLSVPLPDFSAPELSRFISPL